MRACNNNTVGIRNYRWTGFKCEHVIIIQGVTVAIRNYRRTGFKCEHVIIANCYFSPSAQLLERNVYITCIRTYVRTGVINT